MAYTLTLTDKDGNVPLDLIDFNRVKYKKVLNQLGDFSVELNNVSVSPEVENRLIAGSRIYIYGDGDLKFIGIIEKIQRGKYWTISGLGHAVVLTYQNQVGLYENQTNTTIVNDILSGQPIGVGTIDAYSDLLTIRFNDENKLKSLARISNITSQDWWVDFSFNFNSIEHRGSTTSVQTFRAEKNISTPTYDEDYSTIINKITVYGAGDGINQLRATSEDLTSQSIYGIREPDKPITDRSLITQESCQALADAYIERYKEPRKAINFEISDLNIEMPDLGDLVTIEDEKNNFIEDVRVTKIEEGIEGTNVFKNIEVSTSLTEDITTDLEQLGRDTDMGNTAPQGATNIYQVGHEENGDATHPVTLKFYIPPTCQFINRIRINFSISAFRSYSQSTAGGGAYTTADTTDSEASHSHDISATIAPTRSESNQAYLNNHEEGINSPFVGATAQNVTDFYEHIFFYSLLNSSGSTKTWFWELYEDGITIDSDSWTLSNGEGLTGKYETTLNMEGSLITYGLPFDDWTTTTGDFSSMFLNTITNGSADIDGQTSISTSPHNHSVTISIPDHTHQIQSTIYEDPYVNPEVEVIVNGTSIGTFTEDQNDIDITSYFGSTGGSWNTIEFKPNQLLRINANCYIQVYLEGITGNQRQ